MLLAPLLLAAAAQPAAADPALDADLRCVAALSFAVSKASPEQRGGLIAGTMYFVGRIDARRPSYDYTAGLRTLLTAGAGLQTIADEAPRCAATMKERGEELQRAGDALSRLDVQMEGDRK